MEGSTPADGSQAPEAERERRTVLNVRTTVENCNRVDMVASPGRLFRPLEMIQIQNILLMLSLLVAFLIGLYGVSLAPRRWSKDRR